MTGWNLRWATWHFYVLKKKKRKNKLQRTERSCNCRGWTQWTNKGRSLRDDAWRRLASRDERNDGQTARRLNVLKVKSCRRQPASRTRGIQYLAEPNMPLELNAIVFRCIANAAMNLLNYCSSYNCTYRVACTALLHRADVRFLLPRCRRRKRNCYLYSVSLSFILSRISESMKMRKCNSRSWNYCYFYVIIILHYITYTILYSCYIYNIIILLLILLYEFLYNIRAVFMDTMKEM